MNQLRLLVVFSLALAASVADGAMPEPAGCPDQAAALLPSVEALIADFQEQARTALSTPRMSLTAEIAKLRTILRHTLELREWPESSCGFRLREKLDAAESFDIQRLEEFRSGSKESGARRAAELWSDADRQLKALRELVEATRR